MTHPNQNLTDYLAVATEWHRRGFFTTPVKPMAKHPRLNEWNTHPAKNLSVAIQHACDYPHDDVGLVSTRGVGRPFWLDIDHNSVEARILHDTREKLSRTLTTSTRPKTAPWKKHLCFRQTPYSVAKWRTEMTGIRDFTMPKDAEGKVPNLFDVKGCGGGGFVVAAGCCRQIERATGVIDEQYTVTDDAPVIDVPDWLVNWVLIQYRRFRADDAVRRAAEADLDQTMKAALFKAETERRGVIFEYDPTKDMLSIDAKGGALVPKEYRNGWLKSLAGELATRGIPRAMTERMLQIAAEVCEPFRGGEDEKDKAIQNVVNRLRIGNLWVGRKQIRDAEQLDVTGDVTGSSQNYLSVLRLAAKELPWDSGEIPSHQVNERLRDAAKRSGVFKGENAAWRQAVSRALRGIGAKSKKSRSPSGQLTGYWTKETQTQEPPLGSTSNAVTVTGDLKDLAALESGASHTEHLQDTREAL